MKMVRIEGLCALWLILLSLSPAAAKEPTAPVRVVVWDEQQPLQKKAYPNFLGNHLAAHLKTRPDFEVRSVRLDDPHQGLSDEVLNQCDVLIWWGHVRHSEVKPRVGQKLVERIKQGKLSLIILHSAHWSTPFIAAMNERARLDALKKYPAGGKEKFEVRYLNGQRNKVPKRSDRVTPYVELRKFPNLVTKVTVTGPSCVFPAWRPDGKSSYVTIRRPEHPIARGLPRAFKVAQTEMYDEPFHIPQPDEVILEERWPTGEWFRSGCVWNLGQGKVFYFRPGHETYKVYHDPLVLKIIENASRWLGSKPGLASPTAAPANKKEN